MTEILEADYLVVGAGAMGMAFVDALLDESDAHVVMVDRHARPGGHWGDAYGFVRLHQPSAFYGVNSRPLGSDRKDTAGPNRGLYEAASGQELLDYFEAVMREKLLASGRVRYLPLANYAGQDTDGLHVCQSLRDGGRTLVRVKGKVVHATHTGTAVPATHPPRYGIGPGIQCLTPNELPGTARTHRRYTVVGSGKTGMDACIRLLEDGVEPGRIRWIMPNDAWFVDRANVQPGVENLERFFGSLATQFECIATAGSMLELFELLEARGELLRIDPQVQPTKYRCATVSREELARLRTIQDVVRLGRVQRIERSRMVLEQGTVDVMDGELFIDCSACAIPARSPGPVFEGDAAIHLHYVRTCAPSFSAAMIAVVECRVPAADKNAMCRPVPPPAEDMSWLQMWAVSLENRRHWSSHKPLMQWLAQSRLDHGSAMRHLVPEPVMQRYAAAVKAAAPRIPALLQVHAQQAPASLPA